MRRKMMVSLLVLMIALIFNTPDCSHGQGL